MRAREANGSRKWHYKPRDGPSIRDYEAFLPETPSSGSVEYTPLSLLRSCVETAENLLQQLDVSAKEPVTDGVIHDANGTREEINTEYEEAIRLAKRLDGCHGQLDAYLSDSAA